MGDWTFLTNHGAVLLCVAEEPRARVRDIAERTGITERATQRILGDLVEAGYLERAREGRRNCYEIHPEMPMRRPEFPNQSVGELIAAMVNVHSHG
jgi:predicted ArsR family transcriptional regulator